MKFDLIISNPPYKNNLHLKILNEVKDLSDKICFIHPSTWLYDNKDMFNLFVETKENFKDRFAHFEVVENANELFGIGAFVPIIISVFDKNNKDLLDIYDMDIHGGSNVYRSMKAKILDYCKVSNVHDNTQKNKNKNKYEVGISVIAPGGMDVMIQKTNECLHIGSETKYENKFYFNTKQEAINFKDYLKTKMSRFCLSIYKLNQNLDNGELASVPYLPTYEHNWTDEMVAKEIGLSDEELRWAINYIPDYYPEDKEIYIKYKKNTK